MKNKGQSTIEYLVVLSVFFVLLAGIYSISIDMDQRRQLIESQMEGQRVANLLAREIDIVADASDGFWVDIFLEGNPNQTIIVAGPTVLALGHYNQTIYIARMRSNLTYAQNPPLNFTTDKTIRINRSNGVVYVQPQG